MAVAEIITLGLADAAANVAAGATNAWGHGVPSYEPPPPVGLPVCLPACLPALLSVCLSGCLSVCLFGSFTQKKNSRTGKNTSEPQSG